MNPYLNLLSAQAQLRSDAAAYPLGGFPPAPAPAIGPGAPTALVFSPHPDDECIVGGLALRLRRQTRWRIVNVAVTLGSNRARQAERRAELEGACRFLGFGLLPTRPDGLDGVNLETRAREPEVWNESVRIISSILAEHQPVAIFFPHPADWNSTHIGTHFLVRDALASLPAEFNCFTLETEFWAQMPQPNLLVESSVEEVADLMAAISFHAGEVRRNPYHLRLPAWMEDNVRRGGEWLAGQGNRAPDFGFATLYRLARWRGSRMIDFYQGSPFLARETDPSTLFRQ